ncbi:ABC transporter permease [Halobacteria archaeon HArc-gm2]|nr:ABC transporter permease [Halobacteria archaeon HArc-gm2]
MIPVKHTETDAPADGFDWHAESSDVELTRGERFWEFYEHRVYQPMLIAWSDLRTRIGLVVIAFYLLLALIGELGLWRAPSTSQAPRLLGMFENMAYPLGTTSAGVDLTAAIIHSTSDILLMVLAGGVWATGVALLVGVFAGYKGGMIDNILMSVSDFFMAIPGLPLVIILAITFSPENPIFVGVILTINYWAGLGRSLRSQVLTIREDSYVEASRTMGVSTWQIMVKDIIPNLMPYVTVNFVFAARYTIFASVGLYFLGVLPYSTQTWGVTLARAQANGALFVPDAAHWLIAPMIAIVGLALGLILLGQGMDKVFNPRVRTRLAGESETTEEGEDDSITGGTL